MTTATTLPWWSLMIILAGLGIAMTALIRWLGRSERAEAGARRAEVAAALGGVGWNATDRADLGWSDGGLLPLFEGRTVLATKGPRVVYDTLQQGAAVAGCNSEPRHGDGSARRGWLRHTVVACAGRPTVLGWVLPSVPTLTERREGRQGFFLLPQVGAQLQASLTAASVSAGNRGAAAGLVDAARAMAPAALQAGRPRHALERQHPGLSDRVLLGARPSEEPLVSYAHWLAELVRDLLDEEPGLMVECAAGGVLVSKRVDRRAGVPSADAPDLDHGLLSPAELERFVAVAERVFERLKMAGVVDAAA